MGLTLDFTGLNNIALEQARNDFTDALEGEEVETTIEELKAHIERNISPQGQETESLALIKLAREQEDHNRTLEVYSTYQNNIKKSECLQTEILKGVRAGESTHTLLLKACETIALMTGNSLFYGQIEADLQAIYGEGLLEEVPLEWQLDEARERKRKLEEAYNREGTAPDARERIKKAIVEHEKKIMYLQELLQKEQSLKQAI